jgi:uncharacterized repeat protein (TIGR01451 family)
MSKLIWSINMMKTSAIEHKQKQIKGGFMKPTRFLTVALVLLGLVAMVHAAGTPAGTVIQNQAKGAYQDANGNEVAGATEGYVFSNTVSTTVSQVAGADFGDDQASNVSALDTVLYDLTFTNTGNGTDSFGLFATPGTGHEGNFTYQIWHDIDDDGSINNADTIATTTGPLAADGEMNLLIKVIDATTGGAPEGDIFVLTITGQSVFNTGVSDATVLTSTVQAAAITATISIDNPSPIPGDEVIYSICIVNNGTATGYNLVFNGPIPDYTTYVAGSIRIGTTGWANGTLLTDAVDTPTPDAGDFNVTASNTVTVDLGDLAGSGNICVYFKVTIDAGTPEGTPIEPTPTIEYENGGGNPYPPVEPTGDTSIDIVESFGVDIAATGTTSFTGDPGDSLFYAFSVENLGNGTDSDTLTASSDFVVWTFYADNGDGILSAAELSAGPITVTGNLDQNEVAYFVAVGIIPPGTADAAVDATTFTATSQGDPSESDTDTADATCTAPVVSLTKSVSPTGNQPPGTTLTYTIIVTNAGTGVAKNVVVTDAIPDNTSYVDDSMKTDASTVEDDDDADGAAYTGTAVIWTFSTMDADGGTTDSHTLEFKVTID